MSEKLPEFLLDRAVEYHCRKGLRQGCDCTFCMSKRAATRAMADGYNLHSYIPTLYQSWFINYDYKDLMRIAREKKRVKIRQQLNDLKKIVL